MSAFSFYSRSSLNDIEFLYLEQGVFDKDFPFASKKEDEANWIADMW